MANRIAPTLWRLTNHPIQRGTWFPPGTTLGDVGQALRELRALIAVARAAERALGDFDKLLGDTDPMGGYFPGEPGHRMQRLSAALQRLRPARASRGRGRGRA